MITKITVIFVFFIVIINGQVDPNSVCRMNPFTPLNGKVTYSSGSSFGPFNQGTIATLTCNQGYSPKGITQLTCINGKFSPSQFDPCGTVGISGSCHPFSPVANGQITYTGGSPNNNLYPLGTSALLTCNLGYLMSGPGIAFCSTPGWSISSLGSCSQH